MRPAKSSEPLDALDRALIDRLQDGIALAERPFAPIAAELGIDEDTLLARLAALLARGTLSRFGPLYNAAAFGGAVTLAALAVPAARYERVAALVNAHPEVAHNYARDHALNMWFVLAAERAADIERVLREIESETGLPVLNLPKLDEYFLDLRLTA
jgi:DNA-binding Lrp family transcriptional regulator